MDLRNALFICLGNINRSPAAEMIWRKEIGGSVSSCGFSVSRKSISKRMADLLEKEGISSEEISGHLPKVINEKILNWATVIFCMNRQHIRRLISEYKIDKRKLILLPSFANLRSIVDPGFSSDIVDYERCLREIKISIRTIKSRYILVSYPIVVTTKGRWHGEATILDLFDNEGIKYILTLEKEDVDNYLARYKNVSEVIVLEKSDMGVGYSRQKTLEYIRKKYGSWYWVADDDITKFMKYNATLKKWEKIRFFPFIKKGEMVIDYYKKKIPNLAMIGYRQNSFGLQVKKPLLLNARAIQFLGLDSSKQHKKKMRYDSSFVLMGDEEFLINLLSNGLFNIKINHFLYSCPYSMKRAQKGGINYNKVSKYQYLKLLKKRYPDIVKIVSKAGSINSNPQYSINWGKIKKKFDIESFDLEDIEIGGYNYSMKKPFAKFL